MAIMRGLRWLRAQIFESIGVSHRARKRLDGSCALVLTYHRVFPGSDVLREAVEPGMYVTSGTFARQLSWFEEYFRVLPLHEIVTRLAQERALPPGACSITFDDGWRDNYEYALPELERRGLPATIFVVTERVATAGAFWPDEVWRRMSPLPKAARRRLAERFGAPPSGDPVGAILAHLKSLDEPARGKVLDAFWAATDPPPVRERELLDWDELERLARAGIDVESHGATHAILTHLPDEGVERELRSARERLRDRGHGRHGLFAYPSGGHDERVKSIVKRLGYRAAFTTVRGLAHGTADPMALPRLGLHEEISRTRVEFLHRIPGSARAEAAGTTHLTGRFED